MATKKKLLQAAAGVGGEPEGAWDLSYAYFDDPFAWDISSAVYIRNYSVGTQETTPTGVFFKSDGTKMYIVGNVGDDVNEYNLSTAWNISTATYSQNFSVSSQDTTPYGIFFKPDGTKMYMVGNVNDRIYEYTLSTAWDISTASFNQYFSVNAQETVPMGVYIKPDGTKMYVTGVGGDDVNEYDLSTAWDISTASYLQNFSIAAQDNFPTNVFFKDDGTRMYVIGTQNDNVNEYILSTAWDISTASYNQNFSLAAQDTTPQGIYFKPDGSSFYICGSDSDHVYHYILGGFDVVDEDNSPQDLFFKPEGDKMYVVGSTGDEVNEYSANTGFSVFAQTGTDSTGFFFKDDGSKMYVLGQTGSPADAVHEYDLSTSWDTGTASFLQSFSVASQENAPTNLFFKSDGTKMYVIGTTGDDVNEYNLSTAWDVSTSTYSQSFSFAAQENNPRGIYFKDDGTKMYISGVGSNAVNEYNLSTAWDVTTASYSQNFSVLTQENNNRGLFFKSDGTKMYLSGTTGDAVYEYDLSTAWDVSTATYNQNFSVADQEATVQAVFFKPDGTRMFITGQATDSVYAYNLSTAYDVSSAESPVVPEANLFNLSEFSYTRTFSVAAQEATPLGLSFKDDGTKMYVIGATGDDVNEYDLSTAWNISTATYSQNFSVSSQEASPQALFFKPEGDKMYIVGVSSDTVYEYNLSTAWDISTASYASNSFSVASQETVPTGLFFKDDGTKMYIFGSQGDDITEYDLSTAWDVSTASYVQNYVTTTINTPTGIYFKPDGTKVFLTESFIDKVLTYSLGVQE